MHQVPTAVRFRGMTPSPAATAAIERQVERLSRVYDRIVHCDVVVEQPHRSQRTGALFHIRIDLVVPTRTISVSRDHGTDATHEDVYAAIADAFRAARRQLEAHAEIQRGEIKAHA